MSLAYDLSAAAQEYVPPEFVACIVPGCRWLFVENDGFDGRCPDCVLILIEHAAGGHRNDRTIACSVCD